MLWIVVGAHGKERSAEKCRIMRVAPGALHHMTTIAWRHGSLELRPPESTSCMGVEASKP